MFDNIDIKAEVFPDVGPFQIVVHTWQDLDCDPRDCDCYDANNIEAWENDQWFFVGITVEVYCRGIVLCADHLGGIESVSNRAHVLSCIEELQSDAIDGAKAKLKDIFALCLDFVAK